MEKTTERIDGIEIQFVGHMGHGGAFLQHFFGIRQSLFVVIFNNGCAGEVHKGPGEVEAAVVELLLQRIQRDDVLVVNR